MKRNIILTFFIVVCIAILIPGCTSTGQAAKSTGGKTADDMADFEWDGSTALTLQDVYFYDDVTNGGSSSLIRGEYTEDGVFIMEGTVTAKLSYGFLGGGLAVKGDNKNLLSIAKGIKFMTKGDGKKYRIRIESRKVKDFDMHGYVFTAPSTETEITVLYKDLKQEGWGSNVSFNPKDVFQISFQTVGQPHDSISLKAWNFEIIPE